MMAIVFRFVFKKSKFFDFDHIMQIFTLTKDIDQNDISKRCSDNQKTVE